MLSYKSDYKDDYIRIELQGELSSNTCDEFDTHVTSSEKHNILIRFDKLTYLSSMGLRSLFKLNSLIKQKQGKLVFASPSGMVKEVLNISGCHRLLKIFDAEAEALSELGRL